MKGLFLQLEINNRIYFSSLIEGDSKESFMKVWESAGPKLWEKLVKENNDYLSHGSIRISPVTN